VVEYFNQQIAIKELVMRIGNLVFEDADLLSLMPPAIICYIDDDEPSVDITHHDLPSGECVGVGSSSVYSTDIVSPGRLGEYLGLDGGFAESRCLGGGHTAIITV